MAIGPHIFDEKNPYQSLVNFTNKHHFLYQNQKIDFFRRLENFFTPLAYNDESRPMGESYSNRFQFEAINLWDVAEQVKLQERFQRIYQLLANIAKVAGIALNLSTSKISICQIFIKGNNVHPDCWGWVDGRYVSESVKLQERLNNGHLYFNPQEIKPQLLLALQRINSLRDCFELEEHLFEITYEMLFDLAIFAIQWEIPSLKKQVKECFGRLKLENDSKEKEEFDEIKRRYNQEEIDEALKRCEITIEGLVSSVNTKRMTLRRYDEAEDSKTYFDHLNVFKSLSRFVGRCCVLSTASQLQFYSAVRYFFSAAYNPRPEQTLSQTWKEQFTFSLLPFVLSTQQVEIEKRHQFLASIQRVFNQRFPNLSKPDQLELLHYHYGTRETYDRVQVLWISQPENSLILAKTEGKFPIIFQGDHGVSTPEALLSFLMVGLQNSQADWIKKGKELFLSIRQNDFEAYKLICTMLVSYIDREEVRNFVNQLESFEPNVAQLELNDLSKLFYIQIGKIKDLSKFSKVVKQTLECSQYSEQVLLGFEVSATEDQKLMLQSYYSQRFFDNIPKKECRSSWDTHPEKSFIKNLLTTFKDSESVHSEERRNTTIETQCQVNGLKEEDITNIHLYLTRQDVKEWANKGQIGKEINILITALETKFSHLNVHNFFHSFAAQFFPKLVDEKSRILEIIEEILLISTKTPTCDQITAFVKQHPLKDEEVLCILSVLKEERVKKWLSTYAKNVKYLEVEELCNFGYKHHILYFDLALQTYFREETVDTSFHQEECNFLSAFLPQAQEKWSQDLIIETVTAMKKNRIKPEQLSWIINFFKRGDVKTFFANLKQENLYNQLLPILERMSVSENIANEFTVLFDAQIRAAYGEFYQESVPILKHCFQMTHLCQNPAEFKLLQLGILDGSRWRFFSVVGLELIKGEAIQSWLSQKGCEWMGNALSASIQKTTFQFQMEQQSYDFITHLKTKGMDQKLVNFLEQALFDDCKYSMYLFNNFEKERGTEDLKDQLRKTAKQYSLSQGDVKTIEECLSDPNGGGKLTQDYLPKAVGFLKSVLVDLPCNDADKSPEQSCRIC